MQFTLSSRYHSKHKHPDQVDAPIVEAVVALITNNILVVIQIQRLFVCNNEVEIKGVFIYIYI